MPHLNNRVYAQPGTKVWRKNTTVRLHFEINTTYYGHNKVFYCDTIDLLYEPGPAGEGYNLNTFPYVLDSLKVGEYANIKFSKNNQFTNILVKCNFKIHKEPYYATHLYLLREIPESGYYFINLDSLREQSTIALYLLTEMNDITPENWEDFEISEAKYNQLISNSKRHSLWRLFTKSKH